MKKLNFYIGIIFFTIFFACTKNSNEIRIKGDLAGLSNSGILISYFKSDSMLVDTVWSSQNGAFNYKLSVDTLTVLSLYFINPAFSVTVFAEPGNNISVKGNVDEPDIIKVKGNEINNDLTAFKEENKDLLTLRSLLFKNMVENSSVGDSTRVIKLSDAEEWTKINSLDQELIMKAEEYIEKHPERMSSLVLINELFANSENPHNLQRLLDSLNEDVLKSKLGLTLKNYLDKINRSAEGQTMPYFQLTDVKGNTIHSYDYSGKYVLLSFISSTDSKSRENTKALRTLFSHIPKDSVEFITIYIDADPLPVSLREGDSIPWKTIIEPKSWASDIVDAYNVEFLPYNILISPAGTISHRNIPVIAIEKALKK